MNNIVEGIVTWRRLKKDTRGVEEKRDLSSPVQSSQQSWGTAAKPPPNSSKKLQENRTNEPKKQEKKVSEIPVRLVARGATKVSAAAAAASEFQSVGFALWLRHTHTGRTAQVTNTTKRNERERVNEHKL